MRGMRAIALPLCLLLAACGGGQPQATTATAPAAQAPLELARVDVATVVKAPLGAGLPVTGALQALAQTTVQAQLASDVTAVLVREGQAVHRGEILARLGTHDAEARLQAAEANLQAAKVDAQLAHALAERNRSLFEKHFFSELDYQKSTGDAAARDEAVKAQEAEVAIARKALADATVSAPMDGIVARRYIDPGSSVGMDGKLFDIVDLGHMELAAPVPAPQIPQVAVGQTATFTVDGFGQRPFSGRVTRINPVADSGTRAITVYIGVDNPGHDIRGGMFAHGMILTGSNVPALIVPVAAVHSDPGGTAWVLVLDGGTLQRRPVVPGTVDEQGGRMAVLSGLHEGETVVVARLSAEAAGRAARLAGS